MAVSKDKQRVQVTLAKETIKRLDEYAEKTPFKKSDIIELALMDFFQDQQAYQGA